MKDGNEFSGEILQTQEGDEQVNSGGGWGEGRGWGGISSRITFVYMRLWSMQPCVVYNIETSVYRHSCPHSK